jgi:hypothetical protein
MLTFLIGILPYFPTGWLTPPIGRGKEHSPNGVSRPPHLYISLFPIPCSLPSFAGINFPLIGIPELDSWLAHISLQKRGTNDQKPQARTGLDLTDSFRLGFTQHFDFPGG